MKRKFPEWVLKHKRKGTAIHKIGNNYYLYKVTSKWDKNLKRPRKITEEYLGKITPEGLKEPKYKRNMPTTVKEYGSSSFLLENNKEIVDTLKKYFSEWWKEIFVLSVFRMMYKSPLKHMKLHYQDSWISEEIKDVRLDEKSLHKLLEEVGSNRSAIIEFLRNFICNKETLLIDLTHVFSTSKSMKLTAKGFNTDLDFTPQVNILFIFSFTKKLPLFYRVLPGNVRDVSTMKTTIEECGIKDVIIIADKGFYSKENIRLLEEAKLQYILPLKRDSNLVDYSIPKLYDKKNFEGYFKFENRYIWYYRSTDAEPVVWVFLDERLKVREEEDYLNRIDTHPELGYTIEGFHKNQAKFGTISLLTNLKDVSPKNIFQYFKSRAEIEVLFDAFKNALQADRTYMRSDKAMETWMFINFLALAYYYKLYHLLVKHDILSKYSPSDVLLYLSKYRKAKISNCWVDLEMPKQTRKLIEKLKLPIT